MRKRIISYGLGSYFCRTSTLTECVMTYVAAIILGHLKMPVTQFKRALLAMDEKLLSSELLTQILAYAPDHKEVRRSL